jgi:hypothetical protein
MTILTTSCQTTSFDAVIVETPDLVEYSPEVQAKALEELRALGPACPANEVFEGCSALRRFVKDYSRTRDQIRAAKDGQGG